MACALAVTSCGPASHQNCNRPFDRDAWKRDRPAPLGKVSERQHLADQLVGCGTLQGQTRAAVRDLLGPRESGGQNTWTYVTGPQRGQFQVDSELLDVHFTRSGLVDTVTLSNG